MLFNSFAFLLFFPVVTITYFLIPHRFRWALLLSASCFFYMAFIPKYILILGVTILVDYLAGIGLEKLEGPKRRWLLLASILTNIGMLAFFKYFNFANENLAALAGFLHWNYPVQTLSIILPIGLSFHTFQSLSYTIEVYRGNQKAERHLGYLALYVMYYPQLVAGPIERPQNILHQLHTEHKFEYQRVADGLKWMAWGMFKKVVIADRMLLFVNPVYEDPTKYHGPALVLATLAFAIQIYCDFSGYSDIALGSAQVMGVKLMKNFDHPYFARSISEFWRRWHISLSTWFRDYLYIPLGGNRVTRPRWAFNLLLTFLVSGLWHGANWTYVIWGLLHGFYFVISALTESSRGSLSALIGLDRWPRLQAALSTLTTFSLVTFAWIFFRATSLADALYISGHLARGWRPFLRDSWGMLLNGFQESTRGGGFYAIIDSIFRTIAPLTRETRTVIALTLSALVILIIIEVLQYRENLLQRLKQHPVYVRQIIYALLIAVILIFGTNYASKQQAFIYFQF
jgi:D-alanyl-lipoteichoic acid acyltransferase DltB (MBOAT superfamily)